MVYYKPPQAYAPRKCPECGSTEIGYNRKHHWFYCKECGLIISKAFTIGEVTTYMPAPVGVVEFIVQDEWGLFHHFVGEDVLHAEREKVKEAEKRTEIQFKRELIDEATYKKRMKEYTDRLERIATTLAQTKGKRVEHRAGGVEIARADLLKTRRILKDSGRAVRGYRPTLEELMLPAEEEGVTVENVVVSLRQPHEYYGFCELHWLWERVRRFYTITRVFPHVEVATFRRLIGRKKIKRYAVGYSDGVLALLIASSCASPSQATGFLSAMSKDFPEFRGVTVSTVGEALSRFEKEGWLATPLPELIYVMRERVHCVNPLKRTSYLRKEKWWER